MASPRLDVGQGALAWFVAGSLVLASACSSDSNVDFDPTAPSGGGDTSSGGSKPSGNGGGSGAAKGGGSNGTSGEAQGGTSNSAGSSATAGKNSGGSGGTTNNGGTTSSGGKPGGANGGSNAGGGGKAGNGGTANNGGSAGASANAGNGGSAGGGGDSDCVLATFGGHSYNFCGVVDSAPAAYAKCQSLGMKMVEIESLAEQTFVLGKQKGESWLGGSDELKEDEWRWASTTQLFWDGGPRVDFGGKDGRVDGVYSNFIVGQPNDTNVDGFPENCLAINANGWNDLYCNLTGVRAACESTGPVILPNQ